MLKTTENKQVSLLCMKEITYPASISVQPNTVVSVNFIKSLSL